MTEFIFYIMDRKDVVRPTISQILLLVFPPYVPTFGICEGRHALSEPM